MDERTVVKLASRLIAVTQERKDILAKLGAVKRPHAAKAALPEPAAESPRKPRKLTQATRRKMAAAAKRRWREHRKAVNE